LPALESPRPPSRVRSGYVSLARAGAHLDLHSFPTRRSSDLLSLATSLLRRYRMLTPADLDFHLVEAAQRILPEVSDGPGAWVVRSEEHTSELQSRENLVCRLLLEKKNNLTSLPLQNTTSPTP